MTTAALELNDASLAIALAGEVQLTGPGYVALVAGARELDHAPDHQSSMVSIS